MASPNSTLPNDEKEAQDSAYNPGEHANRERMAGNHDSLPGYDRSADGLDDHPISKGKADGKDPQDSADAIRDAEDKGGWDNKTSSYGGNRSKGGRIFSVANLKAIGKKRGITGIILTVLLGGGAAGSLLFTPGIVLVQMREALTDRFNTQFASMDSRTTRLLNTKIEGTTKGVCGSKITIKCKYSTISQKQVIRLKNAGIEVEGTKFGSRTKPTTYTFNGGEPMSAKDFNKRISSDLDLRLAMKRAYNPKFAGFSDNIWKTTANDLKLSKQRALVDGDAETKEKAMNDKVKNGKEFDLNSDGVICDENDKCSKDGTELTEEQSRARRAAITAASEISDEVENTATQAIETTGKTAVNGVANFFKITGAADAACQAYTAVRSLGYAAKTVRAVQLARYAMIFINTADQIKAGTAKAEDVAYLGTIMTTLAYDAAAGAQRKAAMDSAGMKYTMYGEVGGFKSTAGSYASQFMAGGGLTGDLIAVTSYIDAVLGKAPREVCRGLSNGWVQLGSTAGGIALMLIPGVNVAFGALDVIKGIASVSISVGIAILPSLLKDTVAGNVTKGAIGEDAGNAVTSGFGVIASNVAQDGGNGPVSVDEAVAYTTLQNETIARYAADERETLSPLDPTSPNTFIGSIVSKFLPVIANQASLGTSLSTLGSIFSISASSIIPTSSALTVAQQREAYSICSDPDYKEMEIATDPFCNVVYAIPTQFLSRDNIAVADSLAGQYDEETGAPVEGSTYADYVKNCINRKDPVGSGGEDDQGNTGEMCKVKSDNVNNYLFYIDQRIENGMEGYDDGNEPVASTTTDTTFDEEVAISPTALSVPEPSNVATYGVFAPEKATSLSSQLYVTETALSAAFPFATITRRYAA